MNKKQPVVAGGTQAHNSMLRLGTVQWDMRPLDSLNALLKELDFQLESAAGFGVNILLFPELFNAGLMSTHHPADMHAAVRQLAQHSKAIHKHLSRAAQKHQMLIVGGSLPELVDTELQNVAPIILPDGSMHAQPKLHVTPHEQKHWGMSGGAALRMINSPFGRIAVLICYDVEFPELGRILAAEGVQILLVPFSTDARSGYLRVRRCAQARAIENECFVAIAGSVGILRGVPGMDVQFAQSAVFSPADFHFPDSAIIAQATENSPTLLVADVNLSLLELLRNKGSVQNQKDRRTDLYEVSVTSKLDRR